MNSSLRDNHFDGWADKAEELKEWHRKDSGHQHRQVLPNVWLVALPRPLDLDTEFMLGGTAIGNQASANPNPSIHSNIRNCRHFRKQTSCAL